MIVRPDHINALRLNPRTGLPEINPLRDVSRSWAQGTQRAARVALSANAVGEDTIEVQAERGLTGDFEITHFTSDQLAAFRAELYVSGATDKKLMNAPVHVDLLCGSAKYPLYFPTSLFLESRNNIQIRFTNLAATLTTNQVRFIAHGRRFLDYENAISRKELMRQFYGRNEHVFWLTLDDTSAALTADQTGQRFLMSVPGDADFEAEFLLARSTGPFRVTINEGSGAGRPIVSGGAVAGVPSSHVCGTALHPYKFTGDNAYFKRQTKVQVLLDDLSGAANTVEICFVGRLLYYPESPDRAQVVDPGAQLEQRLQATGAVVPFVNPMATSSQAPQGASQPRYLKGPWWAGGSGR